MSSAFDPSPGTRRTGTDTQRADALRAQIESSLGDRFAGALSPAPRPTRETMTSGIEALDAMMGGGLPLGAITELVGPLSSGRTGVALSTVAAAMREGNMCAWVDASDALDPESAAANGVCLDQLLWVRCGVLPGPGASVPANTPGTNAPANTMQRGTTKQGAASPAQPQARAGQHPRDEVRGLDTAVGALLREETGRRDRSIGTPGAPNRTLSNAAASEAHSSQRGAKSAANMRATPSFGPVPREEQVSSDRQPKRGRDGATSQALASGGPAGQHQATARQQGSAAATSSQPQSGLGAGSSRLAYATARATNHAAGSGSKSATPWSRLDQALRAADLLLQAGGFRVLVLDLGSIPPEQALRIPLATWFRFRAAADTHRTVLLALTQTSCARSSAGLVVCFGALEVNFAVTPLDPATMRSPVVAPSDERGLYVVRSETAPVPNLNPDHARKARLIEGIRYHAQPLRQRFTPLPGRVGPDGVARRPPGATWQLSAYPIREQA